MGANAGGPSIASVLAGGQADARVLVQGWVRTKRQSKKCGFIQVGDGSCRDGLQLVVPDDSPLFARLGDITTGCAIAARGPLKASPGGGQSWELVPEELEILGPAGNDYPLQKKGHTLEFLREIGHLRPRSNTFGAVFRLRHHASMAIHQFFSGRGFYWAHTPIITANDAEGAGEAFQVTAPEAPDFFGRDVNLTVSGQLEAEALALALGRVYTFGPTFRAENSHTTRHLAEFWMVEPEVAFADRDAIADLAEEFLREVVLGLVERCSDDLAFLAKHYKARTPEELAAVVREPFERVSYGEAIEQLQGSRQDFAYPPVWGEGLATEHERYLTEEAFKKPVIVTDYPGDQAAFYMRLNDDGRTVANFDLLVPGIGELIGGSQREEREDVLKKRMEAGGLPEGSLGWYLDLRRFGTVPHGGFGLGFERLLMYVSGMANIRDVTLCPRVPGGISF